MSDGVETFVRRINRRADNLGKNVERTKRAAARAMLRAVVVATPADTGRARSNWKVGVGTVPPEAYRRTAYFPGVKLGLKERRNADRATDVGNAKIATSKAANPIFIVNNAPYIGKLNSGSSKQAPAGFIEKALSAGGAKVRSARRLLDVEDIWRGDEDGD